MTKAPLMSPSVIGGIDREHTHRPIKTFTDIQPGDHLCCIYATEEEHRAVLTPYLRAGLERNEKVFYIVDARTRDAVIDYLKTDGVDVDYYLDKGQFSILTVADSYLKGGVFDPDAMIVLLRAETQKALDEGFSALRVTGEMSWALRGLPGSERLIEYENKLNTFFPGSRCLAICQYDRRRFDPAILLDILRTHPFAFIGANLYDNFYFTPPEEALQPHHSMATLNRWIKNIIQRKETEAALRDSEVRFRTMADWTDDWEYWIDPARKFIYISPSVERITGYSSGEFINDPDLIDRIVHPLDRGVWDAHVPRHLKTIKETHPSEIEFRIIHNDGSVRWIGHICRSIVLDDGTCIGRRVSNRDITDRKRAEAALQESKNRSAMLLEAIPDIMFILSRDGVYRDFSIPDPGVLAVPVDQILGTNIRDSGFKKESTDAILDNIGVTLDTKKLQLFEYDLVLPGGERHFEARMVALTEDSVLALVRDITEHKRIENSLKESEQLFRSLAESIPQIVWVTRADGWNIYFNQQWVDYTGLSLEESYGHGWNIPFHPDDRQRAWGAWQQATQHNDTYSIECRLRRADGTYHWWLMRGVPLRNAGGEILKWFGTCTDIESIKRAEEEIRLLNATLELKVEERTSQLAASLDEKIILLREVHHRVKNNLQIIISLLNMQSRQFTDPQLLNAIREIQLRVNAISMVHERLFISNEIEITDLGSYFHSLATTLFSFYQVSQERVHLHVGMENLRTNLDCSVPLGLIVNELISNSLRHAFPGEKTGSISITGTDAGRMLEICVTDNGIGLSPSVDPAGNATLGFRIVAMLTDQLNGTMSINRNEGTTFTLTFPKPPEIPGIPDRET